LISRFRAFITHKYIIYAVHLPSFSYRTLSIHQTKHEHDEKKPASSKGKSDPAAAVREIDAHKLSVNDVFTRFSTSPSQGLESSAVQRLSKLGKNVISPPPTQYYKKALNYVFGGFNFLMWIAFIVTLVRQPLKITLRRMLKNDL
jgi:sodium/potassium-transporting ATPase subunit alpha